MEHIDFKLSWPLKTLLALGLVAVLGLGFIGYLTPGMRVNWETIATMCGF
jgi:hypothetical protein